MRRLIGFWRKDGHVEASKETHKVAGHGPSFDSDVEFASDSKRDRRSALDQRRRRLNRESRHRRLTAYLRAAAPLRHIRAFFEPIDALAADVTAAANICTCE